MSEVSSSFFSHIYLKNHPTTSNISNTISLVAYCVSVTPTVAQLRSMLSEQILSDFNEIFLNGLYLLRDSPEKKIVTLSLKIRELQGYECHR